MDISMIGLHQRTAPVAVREQLAFGPDALSAALTALRDVHGEGFIVSTCNRVEVYGTAAPHDLAAFLANWHGVDAHVLTLHLYSNTGTMTVRHLFRLAAGLDSMVLGEDQIIGQLKGALMAAHAAGSAGPVIHRLLHCALGAGKLARSATAISHHRRSVVSVALDAAEERAGELSERRCLVVGAGEMADLTLRHLRARGVRQIAITNRTAHRAELLAAEHGAAAWPFAELGEALGAADMVISCTSSPVPVIDAPMTEAAMAGRSAALLLVDLAVPRDVAADVDLPGVTVIGVDDLRAVAEAHRAARAADAARAEELVDSELHKFADWMAVQRATPMIRALHQRAESIRAAELERTLARCPELSSDERQAVIALSSAIISRMLHYPIAALKQDPALAETAAEMFQL